MNSVHYPSHSSHLMATSLTGLNPTIHHPYSFSPLLPSRTSHGARSVAALFPPKQTFLTCDGSRAAAVLEVVTTYASLPLHLTLLFSSARGPLATYTLPQPYTQRSQLLSLRVQTFYSLSAKFYNFQYVLAYTSH